MVALRILLVLSFVLGLFVLDRAAGAGLGHLASEVVGGTDGLAVANRAVRAEAEVFVLGSSRAYRHYDPAVLGEALGARVHNAGAPGQSLAYTRGVQDLVLRERHPSLLIVHLDATSLIDTSWDPRMEVLAPFLDDSPVVRRMIFARSATQRVKYLSRAFRFNGRLVTLISERGPDRSPGFGPLDERAGEQRLREVMFPARQEREEERLLAEGPYPERLALLDEMIRASREAGAAVVLATAPRWRPPGPPDPDERRLLDAIGDAARERQVPWIEITLDDHPEFQDPDLWADTQHLNREGADRFSRIVARRLLELGVRERVAARSVR